MLSAPATITGGQQVLAISPDGRRLAYVAVASSGALASQLYLRTIDAFQATPLGGTEGAGSPVFSPDGEWIAFFTGGSLKKISASGGAPLTLCTVVTAPRGATWVADGTIVFGANAAPLMKVAAAGGEPTPFTTLQQGETSHRWPQFLADGKAVLFTAGVSDNYDDAQIKVQRIDSKEQKILLRGGTSARYIPTGHLTYYRAGTLMAVPFDAKALEVTGPPAPVIEGVMAANTGNAQYSVSDVGSLVYIAGTPQTANASLVWVNRQGISQTLPAPPRQYRAPRLSPDGTKVAVGIGNDVWIYDIPRDTLTRFTFEDSNAGTAAVWTPDGKRVAFPSNRAGPTNLFWKAADGSGAEERLTTSPNLQRVGSLSPNGRTMFFSDVSPKTGSDLWWVSLDGERKPQAFLQTQFLEASGLFSPDGRWVSYVSDESGRQEIYVRPFPGPGGKWQISTEGGSEAAWSPKGNEMFFRSGGRKEKMMVVDYQTQPTFSAGKPRLLFEGNYSAGNQGAFYGVAPDGQRFLMMKPVEQQQTSLTQIHVVLNWFEELKRRVPVP
jgi:serine/threonine-protein kinase